MQTRKPTIHLMLIDGQPTGRWRCTLSNWTGIAFKIPRTQVKACTDREELSTPGIYMLFGKDDATGEDQAYIDETECILTRLKQHLTLREFWTECIAFVGSNLNKAYIRYLEHHLYQEALAAGRYQLTNEQTPKASPLSESGAAEMDEFADNILLITGTLGHKLFEPVVGPAAVPVSGAAPVPVSTTADDPSTQYFLRFPQLGIDATGLLVSDGFVVLRGSKARPDTVPSLQATYLTWRARLQTEGILDENFVFRRDYLFTSPTIPACIIAGRSANGRTEWKDADGVTLNDREA